MLKVDSQVVKPALAGRPQPPTGEPVSMAVKWGRLKLRQKTNTEQQKYLYKVAKQTRSVETRFLALKAAGALHFCNSRHIVEKSGEDYLPVGAWNCGKKYCAVCANKKRVKLLRIFRKFFCPDQEIQECREKMEHKRGDELAALQKELAFLQQGPDMLKKYDLALFTVTLQHSKKGLRSSPYYKELGTHFRNALKYGSFKKIIAGGFYNTEHDYTTKNGHHIHRHALVLIPREFDVMHNYEDLTARLREQWAHRTGGSFQIDLKPLGYDSQYDQVTPRQNVVKDLPRHLLEITKYITKRDTSGLIDWQIIESVEKHNRAKFYGRFGILHKVKQLNLNQEKEEVDEISAEKKELFTCSIYVKFAKERITKVAVKRSRKGLYRTAGDPSPPITQNGVQLIQHKKTTGAEIVSWRKIGVSYEARNLAPFENTKESRQKFKENIGLLYFCWRRDKVTDLANGFTVDKWQENRDALKRWNESAISDYAARLSSPAMHTLSTVQDPGDPF